MSPTPMTDARKGSARTQGPKAPRAKGAADAISLTEADPRDIDADEDLSHPAAKTVCAETICVALKPHARIEGEILSPSARDKTSEAGLIDEARGGRTGAGNLIAQIEAAGSANPPMTPMLDGSGRASPLSGCPPRP